MKDKEQLKIKEDEIWEAGHGDPVNRGRIELIGLLRGKIDHFTNVDVLVPETDEDLAQLIAILKSKKESVLGYSMFGDLNLAIIDAQIELCEWAKGGN